MIPDAVVDVRVIRLEVGRIDQVLVLHTVALGEEEDLLRGRRLRARRPENPSVHGIEEDLTVLVRVHPRRGGVVRVVRIARSGHLGRRIGRVVVLRRIVVSEIGSTEVQSMRRRLLCVISGSRARKDLHLVAERFPHQRCARWGPGRLTVDTAGVRNIAIERRAGRLCGPRGGDELVPGENGSLRERGGWCRNRRVRGKCRESRWWDGDGGLRSRRQPPRGKRRVGRGRCRCRCGLFLLLSGARQNDENERDHESDDKTQTSVARHLPLLHWIRLR